MTAGHQPWASSKCPLYGGSRSVSSKFASIQRRVVVRYHTPSPSWHLEISISLKRPYPSGLTRSVLSIRIDCCSRLLHITQCSAAQEGQQTALSVALNTDTAFITQDVAGCRLMAKPAGSSTAGTDLAQRQALHQLW